MYKIIGAVFFVGVLLLASLFFLGNKPRDERVVSFEIEKGENLWNTASNLKKEGIIESKIYFVWYVYKNDYRGKIKAGKYMLSSNLKVPEIVIILTEGDKSGEKESRKITFPEGFSLEQMAKRLTENGFDGDGFLELTKDPKYFINKYEFSFLSDIPEGKGLEGYLFPDTHSFFIEASAEDIIVKILDNFDNRVSEDLMAEIERQNKSVYEILTMASIIEKESNNAEDKKMVSGVFYNRIKNGQALQSCATLAFVLGEDKSQYSYEDTQVNSPYNTYINVGLPPGPITNPGLDSIIAAIYPTKTNYVYFLNNPKTKETIFSTTLEEHNLNKDRNGL